MDETLVRDPITGELVDAETGEVVDIELAYDATLRDDGTLDIHRARARFLNPALGLGTDRKLVRVSPSLARGLREIERIGRELGLPPRVIDRARDIYAILKKRIYRNVCVDRSLLLACIVIAARELGVPIDLTKAIEVARARYGSVLRYMSRIIDLGIARYRTQDPRALIPSIASKLGYSQEVIALATRIASAYIAKKGISKMSARSLVVASVLVAAILLGIDERMNRVCREIGISELTLRRARREICREVEMTIYL